MRKGFTLVELLVAIALFAIAVSVSVGGFVSALRTQRQVIGLLSANSNASLTIEQIARELRTGVNFVCVSGVPCQELSFTNDEGADVTYRLRDGAIEKGARGAFQKVTAENVLVRALSFDLLKKDEFPPRITLTLGISAPIRGIEESITYLQTTVSARRF